MNRKFKSEAKFDISENFSTKHKNIIIFNGEINYVTN